MLYVANKVNHRKLTHDIAHIFTNNQKNILKNIFYDNLSNVLFIQALQLIFFQQYKYCINTEIQYSSQYLISQSQSVFCMFHKLSEERIQLAPIGIFLIT